MRILFLSTWFPYPQDNGSKLRVYHLLRALSEEHEVVLVSFAFDTARPDDPGDLRDFCQEIFVVRANPFTINKAGAIATSVSVRPVVARPIQSMCQTVQEVLKENQFDVVIASTIMMIGYAVQAPKGIALVLEDHNATSRILRERYENEVSFIQRTRRWLSWKKRRLFEARAYANFDLITMVSEQDCIETNSLIGKCGPQVEIITNGVDCSHNRPGLSTTYPNTIVFNGSLTYTANLEAMTWFCEKIYPRIKTNIPDISLKITGSTTGVDTRLISADDSILLTGFVRDIRIPVAEAAVCVVPLLTGGGTRLKILEALALGTPVVSTSKGVEGIDALHLEHLLIADNASSFAQSVKRLLADKELRERLSANGRRLAKDKYDWRPIGAHFVRLVEATVRDKVRSKQNID